MSFPFLQGLLARVFGLLSIDLLVHHAIDLFYVHQFILNQTGVPLLWEPGPLSFQGVVRGDDGDMNLCLMAGDVVGHRSILSSFISVPSDLCDS